MGLALGALVLPVAALAQTTGCSDLSALQVWAGYLSWMGFIKVLGAAIFAAGVLFFTWGLLVEFIESMQVLLEALAYLVSAALIFSGYWVSHEYLTWTVFIGCVLFMGSVFLSLFVHKIKDDDPKPLAALFALVWGAVAIYYSMPEVGTLTMLAIMTLLGFTVVVGRLSYGFGWHDHSSIASGTTAALIILAAFVVQKLIAPSAPALVQVFSSAAFWTGSIVAFTGLLILSSKLYAKEGTWLLMQGIAVAIYLLAIGAGMTLHINPLAGAAGVFLILFLVAKPLEIQEGGRMGFGLALIASSAVLFGAWWLAMQHLEMTKQYFTTVLG
jgi:hypothetical protein